MSETAPKPLITESSTSESTTVEVAMGDLRDEILTIPDYQRDTDQWDNMTKSLLIESVINNLTIPAFFFEVIHEDGVEKNSVVDGQQRLTTLKEFHANKFRLVEGNSAPYLSPNSIHYAGKTFDELPKAYSQAFKKYRLPVIKLRDLGDMRLEIFRRINQGGEPLSGQDIRLAYYGEASPSLAFIRLAGIYSPDRPGPKRFIDSARKLYGLDFPWSGHASETWRDWWADKQIARGQTSSEMFLWALVSAQVSELEDLLKNSDALAQLGCSYNRTVDSALDAFCAQLAYQDRNPSTPRLVCSAEAIQGEFFDFFQDWLHVVLSQKGVSLPVTKYRMLAGVIGGARASGLKVSDVTDSGWANIVEFVRRPRQTAEAQGIDWIASKGRWDGGRGYRAQLLLVRNVLASLIE